jgi:diguanylate cyclase
MKPMNKIKLIVCTFGVLVGVAFPIYAGFFVEWIPERKLIFDIFCILAGFLVGIFSFYVLKFTLISIEKYYKKTLYSHLGIERVDDTLHDSDLLINMRCEFNKIIGEYAMLINQEKKYLTDLSNSDCLTSGYNHRYLYEYFPCKVEEGCDEMTLLFCDIDFFKSINDEYGHVVGDAVLVEIGNIIEEMISSKGAYFRYGGEEFMVVIDLDIDEAYEIARKIRMRVNKSEKICQLCHCVGISIGLASYPEDGRDIEILIDKSDKAMYTAKNNGRNCCVRYKDIEKKLDS